jgi:SAM-dependent methyltransferase
LCAGGDQRPRRAQARRAAGALRGARRGNTGGRAGGPSVRGGRLTTRKLARYYDLDLVTDPGDLPFYLGLATSSVGPILELAAGSGRLAIPLAAAGHDVTGVDKDVAMLDRAWAAWVRASRAQAATPPGSLTLVEHDLTTLSLPTRFDLVILALNSLLLLDGRAAQELALRVMRAHLAPGGRAVVDVWLPGPDDLDLYDGRQLLDWIRTDPQTRERVAKSWSATYDPAGGRATVSTTFETEAARRATTRRDSITFIGAGELLEIAQRAGLQPESVLGDYSGAVWSEASERVVLIAGAG